MVVVVEKLLGGSSLRSKGLDADPDEFGDRPVRGDLVALERKERDAGGLKWLKGEVGMPKDIEKVVDAIAELRNSTPEQIDELVRQNFVRLVAADPWVHEISAILSHLKS